MNFIQFEEVIGRLRVIQDTLRRHGLTPERDASTILDILSNAYPEFTEQYNQDSIAMNGPPRFGA